MHLAGPLVADNVSPKIQLQRLLLGLILDHANAELLHDMLAMLARDLEIAMVVVTHNRSLARRADRALHLEDGVLREADVQGVVG